MPPSKMFLMLTKLQSDLNCLTVRTIDANSSITDILSLYCDEQAPFTDVHELTSKFGNAIDKMTDALEVFQEDVDKLTRYLDAKG